MDLHQYSRIHALVQDNLNTHKAASLHKAIPPAAARRVAERLEWHYTP